VLDPLSIARRCIQYSSTFSQCSGSFEGIVPEKLESRFSEDRVRIKLASEAADLSNMSMGGYQ
jgi:hypothetical protein